MIKKGDEFHIKHEPKGDDVWAMSGPHVCISNDHGLVWYSIDPGRDSFRMESDCVKVEENKNED